MSSRTYSILWCITYYLVVVVVAACMPFILVTGSFGEKLAAYALAMPAAYWMINDARLRGAYVPHVVQPGILVFWYLVVPIYLVKTRKWWGVLYVALHLVCGTATSVASQYLSIALVWPIVFPDRGW